MTRAADATIRYTILFAFLACAIAGLLILAGCSSDYMREHATPGTNKDGVVTDLHKYCLSNPKDSACQGPGSK